jgi:hypothetical protein
VRDPSKTLGGITLKIRADGYQDQSTEDLRAKRRDLAIAVTFALRGSDSYEWINGHLLAVNTELTRRGEVASHDRRVP